MEKIHLSRETLSELYKNNLVLVGDQSDKPTAHPERNFIYKGGNRKNILWLHEEPEHPYLSDEDHEMVTKILEACKLSWQDIALINLFGKHEIISTIRSEIKPDFIIFSLPEKKQILDMPGDLYDISDLEGVKMLCTDSLNSIREDKNLKIRLWHSLKQLFGL